MSGPTLWGLTKIDAPNARKETTMNDRSRAHVLMRMVSAALAVTILAGGLGMSATGTVSARKRATPKLVQAFSNPTALAINDGGATAQSTIEVSGFDTELADVTVTMSNLSHGLPADMDVLLVGPGGQTAMILSDAGAANAANNVTLTLDDQAANQVSSFAPLTNGTFQPTNVDTVFDTFLPPAPASPQSGSELGVFNSTSPNGLWTLFLRDDNPSGIGGTLNGGWSLRIVSANGIPDASPDSFQAQAGKTLSEQSGVLTNDRDPDDDSLTAILAGQPTKGKVNLEVDGSFTYKPGKKAKGTDSFTYLAQDPDGLSDLETVTITIKKAKKKGKK